MARGTRGPGWGLPAAAVALLLLLLAGGGRAAPEGGRGAAPPLPEGELWYGNQTVDHFRVAPGGGAEATWAQRFFANATFFEGDGPVFLCVGGEGPAFAEDVAVTGGVHCAHMIELASEVGALILVLEHRFYGPSMPAADYSTASLELLSSHQALADLAQFHAHATELYGLKPGTKWVTFGGSYPGMMAAWARLFLPHLIHAAVASSAPVQAIDDMVGYNDVVARSMSNPMVGGSAVCLGEVQAVFAALGDALKTADGRRSLEERFNVCEAGALENEKNQRQFAETFWGLFPLQSNDPACDADFCNYEKICNFLTSTVGQPQLDRLKELFEGVAGTGGLGAPRCPASWRPWRCPGAAMRDECLDISFEKAVAAMQNATNADRTWFWQTCSEFGFYQTCNPESQCPFTKDPHLSTLDANLELCELAYGIGKGVVEERIRFSNTFYGGWEPAGSNVMWVNGNVDPWSSMSVLAPPAAGQPAFMAGGASHHFWTHPAKASDQASVVEARREISATVKGWLEDRDGSPETPFAGVYTDPNHPGCRRQIRTMAAGRLALVTGEDGDPGCPPKDPSKDSHWRLLGKIISDTEILVDFSPKGGPKDLEGKWCPECGDHGGISWPDGNAWPKVQVVVQ